MIDDGIKNKYDDSFSSLSRFKAIVFGSDTKIDKQINYFPILFCLLFMYILLTHNL